MYCSSDCVRGRGAPVTYLSHSIFFHAWEKIAPSNPGIKHLERVSAFQIQDSQIGCDVIPCP